MMSKTYQIYREVFFKSKNPFLLIAMLGSNLLKLGALSEKNTAFFLCDMQTKFKEVINQFDNITKNAQKMVDASKILNIPLLVTEQYPKGLGKTIPELSIDHACHVFEKTKFSMVTPESLPAINKLCDGKLQCVVLFGIEAHVCVEQTVIDLLAMGINVHVVADATSSRTQEDRHLAFKRMRQIGCFVTTSENVLFKLIKDKNHPVFKSISQLVKTPSTNSGLIHSKI